MPTTIIIPEELYWDSINEMFFKKPSHSFVVEHSLVSVSKWESKWKKPFIGDTKKTAKEVIDYIKCMTITQNVDDSVYARLTTENLEEINQYIDDKMTATFFAEEKVSGPVGKKEIITSEVIYHWMIEYGVPFECQKWHLNRLITLIKVREAKAKAANGKKVNKRDTLANNAKLNAERRKRLGTSG